ncbi:MAG: sugar phosphate isomerase/epimerase [Thermoguttaceae bacterium]|jgi:sugar phosphate isomerase/epimerase|nr:sugar phosphate isomerase/epimerase [Thermoguttaceae bacterium]
MNISRRDVLKLGAGAAAAWSTGALASWANVTAAKKIPIGLQLYSIRQDAAKDLPGVLKAVAEMGYEGVEFAGYYGHSAEDIRKLLDDNGLKCCGTHTGLNTLFPENFDATVEFNKTIGNKYLIVPGMPDDRLHSVEAIKNTAALFNEWAPKAKEHGMVVGYHAHGGDFRKVDGEVTRWDLLFKSTRPEVVMQMDMGNCIGGGGDPYATLERFPGRSLTVHLKEHGGPRGAAVGEGEVDWKRVFQICETVGGTEWYIVEQEAYDAEPLESVRRCLQNLRKMGK